MTSKVPETAAECQERVEQFVEITQTDEALAQFYLQDHDWEVQASVEAFYAKPSMLGGKKTLLVKTDESTLKLFKTDSTESSFVPYPLSFISWNIDGLSEKNLKIRTVEVAKIILERKTDIVFLQEVVPETEVLLRSKMAADYIFTGKGTCEAYFNLTLLRKATMIFESEEIRDFPNSTMGRSLSIVDAKVANIFKIRLFNTHLESTKDFSEERICQLKIAFEAASNVLTDTSVILAGDLNIRDWEIKKAGGLIRNFEDLWESNGKRKECEFTWDSLRNNNLQISGKFKPRCRFDRAFFRPASSKPIQSSHFGLVGIEKVKNCQCFPSDHWGLFCLFDCKHPVPTDKD